MAGSSQRGRLRKTEINGGTEFNEKDHISIFNGFAVQRSHGVRQQRQGGDSRNCGSDRGADESGRDYGSGRDADECSRDHDHGCSCGCGHDHHGHHHADEVFDNIGVETPKRFREDAIREALEELDDGNGAEYGQILRAKGILPLNDGRWLHFDYVPGETDFRYGPADYTGRLCVIGVKINQNAIKELFGI